MLNDEVDRRTRGNDKCYLRRCPKCQTICVLFRDQQMDLFLDCLLLGVEQEIEAVKAGRMTFELKKKLGYATATWRWNIHWAKEARTGQRAEAVLQEHRC